MPYSFYNGDIGIQTVGAEVLTKLTPDMVVYIINDGPQVTVTTLGTLAAFLSTAPAQTSLTATGDDAATALELPGNVCVFTDVPAGTGAIIPLDADPGTIWDIWNADPANDLLLYPMLNGDAQIEGFGIGNPATVVAGGRSTFLVDTLAQVYAR
jgi:hypothetical protein